MINAQKRKLYEFLGCLYHGDTCQQFREVTSLGGDTQAERYEKIMARLQQLTGLGYTVEVVWECQFDRDNLPHHPELKHPIVQSGLPKTRDTLYGGRTESMFLHYKIGEGETIQYYDVMRIYPYVCKYFKFPLGHPKIHVCDACPDKHLMLSMEGMIKCSPISQETLRPRHAIPLQ